MSLFDAIWGTQVQKILPPVLRGTSVIQFLTGLLKPLQTQTDSLKTFETEYINRAKFNGRKMVLQGALNYIFSILAAPYIIVETNEDIGDNIHFFLLSELQSVDFYRESENNPIYFFDETEIGPDYDFKIKIPAGIHTSELERRVKAETTLYKLAGKQFIIETY